MRNRAGWHREVAPLQRLAADDCTSVSSTIETSGWPPAVRYEFFWCHRRLRNVGMLVAAATLAAVPPMFAGGGGVQMACVVWLAMLLIAANGLARRMSTVAPVITIDLLGITDRRRSDTPLFWQEIGTFSRCDLVRSRVVEFFLIHPERTAGRSLLDRLGGKLQVAYGLPAVTLSLLLVDASAADIIAAVSAFRPGLVPRGMAAV